MCSAAIWIVYAKQSASFEPLPALSVQQNRIVRTDTHEPVVLRGAVSDYFRYGYFNDRLQKWGIDAELQRVINLKKAGINVIGLYLADPQAITEHVSELDTYINIARDNGLYVYLMPVARDFDGKPSKIQTTRNATYTELKGLIDTLASRYATYSNVLYGFGAEVEPDDETAATWNEKQITLAKIVLKYNPRAVLLITGVKDSPGLISYYQTNPFPLGNVIYFGDGYTSRDDADAQQHWADVIRDINDPNTEQFSKTYPYFVGEFGGNYAANFSSKTDLDIISKMLARMDELNLNYSMYKLSAERINDPLSMYDTVGNLTSRGSVFVAALQQYPPTKF